MCLADTFAPPHWFTSCQRRAWFLEESAKVRSNILYPLPFTLPRIFKRCWWAFYSSGFKQGSFPVTQSQACSLEEEFWLAGFPRHPSAVGQTGCWKGRTKAGARGRQLLHRGGLSWQRCAADSPGREDQSPGIRRWIKAPRSQWEALCWECWISEQLVRLLWVIYAMMGTRISFLSWDLIVVSVTKCFETALNMDRVKSFSLLKSIEVIMKKVADSSELSDSINMYSCFSLASGSFIKRCI